MEIISDNSTRTLIEFRQSLDKRLNAGDNVVGKTLDKVEISCNEQITIYVTAQIERKEKLAIEHEELF